MKFILNSTLFNDQNRTELLSILFNALRNLAYIEFDIDDLTVQSWIKQNNHYDWQLAYDTYICDAASYNITNYVYVINDLGSSCWNIDEPQITLNDACKLITCPTQIWVENGRNDGDFFRLFINPESLKVVEELINSGRVKFESLGGIGEMKASLMRNPTEIGYRNKKFVIYDSDAPYPKQLQDDAKAIKNTCETHKIRNHYWSRRAIENYLPVEYLLNNIHTNVRQTSADAKKYQAFLTMNDDQRYHFHMKKGIYDTTCQSSPLFNGLDIDAILSIEDLFEGFTAQFANKFMQKINHPDAAKIRELMLLDDKINELSDIESTLLQYIRVPV